MEKLKVIPKVYWYLLLVLVFAGYFAWKSLAVRTNPVLVPDPTNLRASADNAISVNISRVSFYYEVSGQVKTPGVFLADADLLVEEAIARAGGFTNLADLDYVYRYIMLAVKVKPEQKIYIPKVNTALPMDSNYPMGIAPELKVNLNIASPAQLEAISGVGPAISKKILAARPYHSCQDINKLTGLSKNTKENIIAVCGI